MGSFCGQTLGPLPLGLAQPVIIRQQSLGQDGFAPLSHLLCHMGHRSGTAIAESRRYTEHARDIAIFIIAQSCAITNKKQRLFAIFYKIRQICHRPGVIVQQAGVGGKVKCSTVYRRRCCRTTTVSVRRSGSGRSVWLPKPQQRIKKRNCDYSQGKDVFPWQNPSHLPPTTADLN